jgi:general secretion pathway protein D
MKTFSKPGACLSNAAPSPAGRASPGLRPPAFFAVLSGLLLWVGGVAAQIPAPPAPASVLTNTAAPSARTNLVMAPPGANPVVAPSATNGVVAQPGLGTNAAALSPPPATSRSFPFPAFPAPPSSPDAAEPLPAPTVPYSSPGSNQPPAVRSKAEVASILYNVDPNQLMPLDGLQLNAMPLAAVFEVYAEYSGRIVIPNSAVPAAGTLTLKVGIPLTRMESVQTLDIALAQNGITMVPFGEKWVKAVPAASAGPEGAEMLEGDAKKLPVTDQFVTQVIQLKHVHPMEVMPLLATFTKNPASGIVPIEGSQILVVRDYASNVRRIAELLARVDIVPAPDYRLEVIPIRYGMVDDLYATMSSLIGGGGAPAGGTRGGGRGGRGGGSQHLNSTSGMGGGQPGQYGQPGANINGINPNPAANVNSFQNRVNQMLGRAGGPGGAGAAGQSQIISDAKIVPDEGSNSLLIYAGEQDMIMISNIVARIDRPLPQVLIEAVVLDVSLDKSQTFGVSYLQNPQTTGKLTSASGANNGPQVLSGMTNLSSGLPSGFSYFAQYGGSLEAAVQALAADSTISVISRPRIMTTHAVPGSFVIGTAVPYVTGFQTYGGYVGGTSSSSTVQEKDITTDIEVTPFITPDGLVVMDIDNQFDEPGVTVNIGGNPYPVVNERHATSRVTVRDGETIMMGGYITSSKTKSISGVPYLMNIPLLGALFRSKNTDNQREELIVLMRATILKTAEAAHDFATKERKTNPGIRQAEDEERKFVSDRLKAVEKNEAGDKQK